MGTAAPPPTLHRLRQTLAGIDPSLAPRLGEEGRSVGLGAPIDAALGGGLLCGALHELAPAAPMHLAAASGFAAALAVLASGGRGQVLWVATDFAAGEGGGPYGPGLDLFGMAPARLLMLRVPRAVDVLWAMEEALRCRALDGGAERGGDPLGDCREPEPPRCLRRPWPSELRPFSLQEPARTVRPVAHHLGPS
jgi:hypothetical protein